MTELILTGIDDFRDDNPTHYRLVFFVEGGGKLAVWGRNGNTANIKRLQSWIAETGFKLRVAGDWREPEAWSRQYGHTYWLEETNSIQRV